MRLFDQYKGLRKEVYVLFFGRIVTNLGSMVWPMMTMILNRKLGMEASNIALLMVLSRLFSFPAVLLGGKLADRFNKKRIIVSCDLVSVAGYLVCAFLPLGIHSVIIMLVAGTFQGMEYPAYNALLADITTTKDRERAFSLQYLGGNIGLMLSPTISGFLFEHFLWLAFLISGVGIGCSTLLIYLKIKDITPVVDTEPVAAYQAARDDASLFSVLRENKSVLLFAVIGSFFGAAYAQYQFLMPLDMGNVHGESGAVIYGTVTSLNCIIVVIFTPLITRWFSRMKDTEKLTFGKVLVLAGYGIFLVFLGNVPFYYAAITFFTWGEIFNTIAEGPYLTNRVPSSHRGRVNSANSFLHGILSGVFELGLGRLYDLRGSTAAWIMVLSATALTVILSVMLGVLDRRRYPMLYQQTDQTRG